MGQCLSVFAAAAGPPITGRLCVAGEMMLTLDELDLTLTLKTKCKHDGQTLLSVHYQHNTAQFLCV